jgi:hypothetical protein
MHDKILCRLLWHLVVAAINTTPTDEPQTRKHYSGGGGIVCDSPRDVVASDQDLTTRWLVIYRITHLLYRHELDLRRRLDRPNAADGAVDATAIAAHNFLDGGTSSGLRRALSAEAMLCQARPQPASQQSA